MSYCLTALGILLLYVGSETCLRRFVFRTDAVRPKDNVTLKSVLNLLPLLIRAPLEHQIKVADLREKLAKSQKPADTIKATYELARELSPRGQWRLFRGLVTKFPDNPECTTAMVALVKEGYDHLGASDYIAFADRCPAEKRKDVLRSGWPAFGALPAAPRRSYQLELLKREITDPGLEDLYASLQNQAGIDGDQAMADQAAKLRETCRNLMLEQLKRKNGPPPKPAKK